MIGAQPELKLYRRPMARAWWLKNPRYTLYMLREISSVFIGVWIVLFLVQLAQLGSGQQAYQGFVDGFLRSPIVMILNLAIFIFAMVHSITWNQLTGVIQVVRIGDRELPPRYVAGGAFATWLVASLVIAAVMLVG